MTRNQNEEFVQHVYACWMTTQQTFLKMFCNETAINPLQGTHDPNMNAFWWVAAEIYPSEKL